MNEVIELAVESADGIIDCRLEPQENDGAHFYSATILYPNTVSGYSRSEIYCYDIYPDTKTGTYSFEEREDEVIPKIKKLEPQIANAIKNAHSNYPGKR